MFMQLKEEMKPLLCSFVKSLLSLALNVNFTFKKAETI